MASGPLAGMKILEFAGIGPVPFLGMLLSDMGADVIRIDRKHKSDNRLSVTGDTRFDVASRGRRSVALDLKNPDAIETCMLLAEKADAIIEGFRPGAMERLGLGPDQMLARNPRLVYGRLTGWGQTGPLSKAAAHDINYIAITGALHAIGPEEQPLPPLNLIGDYGGGSLYLAFGLLAAIIHAGKTGNGQVVDCAISDGTASLMTIFYGMLAENKWSTERYSNMLDGGAHYYATYQCADDKWISIGSGEPQFYQQFRELAGLDDPEFDHQLDKEHWPSLRNKLKTVIKTRTRAQWCELMEGTDACFAPVLDMTEAPEYSHNRERNTFVSVDGVVQPAPAPRFSLTESSIQGPPPAIGEHSESGLKSWGIDDHQIGKLKNSGAL